MTVYILAGGNDRRADSRYGDRVAAIVKKIVANPVILSSFLSWPEDEQHQHWLDYEPWFKEKFGDVTVLEAKQDTFYELAEKADVIYLHGGYTSGIMAHMPDFERSKAAFKNKIVIGSSAGANYLSTFCVSPGKGLAVQEGSGILGQPVMVHYRAETFEDHILSKEAWDKAESELSSVSNGAGIICLSEGQFTVVVR